MGIGLPEKEKEGDKRKFFFPVLSRVFLKAPFRTRKIIRKENSEKNKKKKWKER